MHNSLTQTTINEYGTDASKTSPDGTRYSGGVEVNYTAPAKWFNWLFNIITKSLNQLRNDKADVLIEMTNVVTESKFTPSDANDHQLSQAVNKTLFEYYATHDEITVTEIIDGVEVTHKVNQPFVAGHTLYFPNTSIL